MIRIATLALFLGILILHHLPQLPPRGFLILAPLAIISLFIFKSYYTRIALISLIGFGWAHIQADHLIQTKLPEVYIGKNIQIEGYIASLPRHDNRKARFEFDVEKVLQPEQIVFPKKLVLSWYKPGTRKFNVGDKWRFTVRVKPSRTFANPGGFDYNKWLLQKGILASGYIRSKQPVELIESNMFAYPLQRLRQSLQARLNNIAIDAQVLPFVRALVIGDRSGLKNEDWVVLQKTGTIHLMAISGLHIGLIATFMFFVARYVWSRIPGAALYFAAPRAAAIIAWIAAFFYSALAGFALPTQRAMIMLSVVLFALVLKKRIQPTYVFSAALALVLLYDSFAVLSASFWLSFGAVAFIYYFIYTSGQITASSAASRFKFWLSLQIFISISLLPLTIQFFQQAPILSPLANVVAVPVVGFIIVPLSFIGCLLLFINDTLALAVFDLIKVVFSMLWSFLEWFSDLSFSTYAFATPSIYALILAILGLAMVFLPRVLHIRISGLICCIPILFPFVKTIDHGEFRLSVLDVGQGLSIVLQTQRHNLVFDAGPKFSRNLDAGRAVVIPFLREKAVKKLDTLLISHADNDHIGGANSILSGINVTSVLTSNPDKISNNSKNTIDRCVRGQRWNWDAVQFEIIHPDVNDYSGALSENNLSCVLLVTSGNQQVLLTGDIEREAENLILRRYPQLSNLDLIVAPHHGSKTSSSQRFVQQLRPEIAIIPVGWRNRFHFPHAQVLDRYRSIEADIYQTSESGEISFDSTTQTIGQYRQQNHSYWD